jgi:hypothetical protein
MPEQGSGTAIAPIDGEYLITVKEFDAAGRATTISFPMPETSDFALWSLKQQVGMLKRGPWSNSSLPDITWGLMYARQIGADAVKGDIFPTGAGRWGTSNKYKIRKALESGNIVGIETDIVELNVPINLTNCPVKKDLECTATIWVKGWTKPIVRKARLSRWFKASNPNWQGNPEHMLELNTVAHACEYVTPGATEDDEQPPVADAPIISATAVPNTPKGEV